MTNLLNKKKKKDKLEKNSRCCKECYERTVFLLDDDNVNCTAKRRWVDGVPCLRDRTNSSTHVLHFLYFEKEGIIEMKETEWL